MICRIAMMAALAVMICGGIPSNAEAREVDPTNAVVDASKAIVSAFGQDDPDAYFKLFAPDATFIFHTTQQRLEDRRAYELEWATWRRNLGFRVRSCTSSNQRVQLFGEIAILSHDVRTEITTNEGDAILMERETIVFHRRGDRWIAVHEHLSPRAPVTGNS
jgi:ketosteroid isomerase-like protein